jgi:hypothetical protein
MTMKMMSFGVREDGQAETWKIATSRSGLRAQQPAVMDVTVSCRDSPDDPAGEIEAGATLSVGMGSHLA